MSRLQPAAATVAFFSAAVVACAYYNGLYNANRLASDAGKAQREGRIGEARSLWSQAAVKAESVATRHPGSRYRDDALLLQGQALSAIGECGRASVPLENALSTSPDDGIRKSAALALGQCSYSLGDFARAIEALQQLVDDPDTIWSRPGRLWRGRSLLAVGSYQQATADLEQAERGEAAFDLSIAYTLLGRLGDARSQLEFAISAPYVEQPWISALDTLGRSRQSDAAALVTMLVQRSDLDDLERSRLLLDDGRRWAALDQHTEAVARFRRAVELAPTAPAGRAALLELTLIRLRHATGLAELPQLADTLVIAVTAETNGQRNIAELVDVVRGAAAAVGASEPAAVDSGAVRHRDLEIFLRAEEMRDLVEAPGLAAAMFLEIVERFPDSPIAPKALIAAAQLDPARSDSLLLVVHVRYTGSPYTLILRGAARDRYSALEDSLRTLIATMRKPEPREN